MTQQVIDLPPTSDLLSAQFFLGNVGAPFAIGMAVGYFAKKMLKTALFVGGGLVVLMFAGEYYGVLNVNGAQLEFFAGEASQVARDSGNFLLSRVSTITTQGVSTATGFALGFKLG